MLWRLLDWIRRHDRYDAMTCWSENHHQGFASFCIILHHYLVILVIWRSLSNQRSEMIRVSDTWNHMESIGSSDSGAGHRHSKLGSADSTGVGSGVRHGYGLLDGVLLWIFWIVPLCNRVYCSGWFSQHMSASMLHCWYCWTDLHSLNMQRDRCWRSSVVTNWDPGGSDSHNMSQAQAAADKLDVKLREKWVDRLPCFIQFNPRF